LYFTNYNRDGMISPHPKPFIADTSKKRQSSFNSILLDAIYKWQQIEQCYSAEIHWEPVVNIPRPSLGCNTEVLNFQLNEVAESTTHKNSWYRK